MSAEPHVPPDRICQLKITLAGVDCWRRVLIHSDASLGDLHWVIQEAMRWDDDHLHGFTVGSRRYGAPGYDMSEDEIAIGEAFTRTRQRIGYTYDFGDDWHTTSTLSMSWTSTRRSPTRYAWPVAVLSRRSKAPNSG